MTLDTLSPREREIITIISEEGLSNKALCFRMGITEPTVKLHIRTAMRKMGAGNRVQCVILYWKAKLADQ